MNTEKKVYETPEVTKVEFDASERITASGCPLAQLYTEYSQGCHNTPTDTWMNSNY